MSKALIRVLIVEDDPMIAELHRRFVQSVDGFVVVGEARDGKAAAEQIAALHPQLVILDVYMPETDGLRVLKQLRRDDHACDVIMVTAAHEAKAVTEAMRLGVVDYIVKPFRFERLKQSLDDYQERRKQLGTTTAMSQDTIDQLWKKEHGRAQQMPKGLNQHTLSLVIGFLRDRPGTPFSADDVALQLGVSRATARRYLEHMLQRGMITQSVTYGSVGRPVNFFSWSSSL